jgi:hypothetical protein
VDTRAAKGEGHVMCEKTNKPKKSIVNQRNKKEKKEFLTNI